MNVEMSAGFWIALVLAGLLLAAIVSMKRKTAAHRLEEMARERVLEENGYFVGRPLADAVAAIGDWNERYPRWGERVDYFWALGSGGTLLICGAADRVTDYRPSRREAAVVQRYFEQHADALAGVHIDEIWRQVGHPRDWGSLDHGVSVYNWTGSGNTLIEVWTKNEQCTSVTIREKEKKAGFFRRWMHRLSA